MPTLPEAPHEVEAEIDVSAGVVALLAAYGAGLLTSGCVGVGVVVVAVAVHAWRATLAAAPTAALVVGGGR